MTYILAIKRHGETVLLADTAVSIRKPEHRVEMTAFKTGRLSPGCLCGLAGHAEAGRQFVIDCTNRIIHEGTLEEFWIAFNEEPLQLAVGRGRRVKAENVHAFAGSDLEAGKDGNAATSSFFPKQCDRSRMAVVCDREHLDVKFDTSI